MKIENNLLNKAIGYDESLIDNVTLKCKSCGKENGKERTIKENGVVGYYDVKVFWCDKCASNHNCHLVETWG